MLNHIRHLRDVTGSFLNAHDIFDLREPRQRARLDVHTGAPLHAVHDDRNPHRRCNGLEVQVKAFLCRLVVVRSHRENSARPQALDFARQLDDFLRVVAAGSGQHRNFAFSFLNRDLDYAEVLRAAHRGILASCAARDKKVNTRIDLAADELAQRGLIEG